MFLGSLTLFGFVLIDVFSQMSDSNGLMVFSKFDQFLKEVLKLPTAVFEGPSFGYTEHSVRTCFPQQVRAGHRAGPRGTHPSTFPQDSPGGFSIRIQVLGRGRNRGLCPGWGVWEGETGG